MKPSVKATINTSKFKYIYCLGLEKSYLGLHLAQRHIAIRVGVLPFWSHGYICVVLSLFTC